MAGIKQMEDEDNLEREVKQLKDNFKVITGGKEPPSDGEDKTWLELMAIGTLFLIKERPNPNTPVDFKLGQFQKVGETEKSVIVMTAGIQEPIFVDPKAFCNKYRLFENLGLFLGKDTDILETVKEQEDNNKKVDNV